MQALVVFQEGVYKRETKNYWKQALDRSWLAERMTYQCKLPAENDVW